MQGHKRAKGASTYGALNEADATHHKSFNAVRFDICERFLREWVPVPHSNVALGGNAPRSKRLFDCAPLRERRAQLWRSTVENLRA
eukprot:scaffold259247_cov34-Tisochrysis_lutea.AAC.2